MHLRREHRRAPTATGVPTRATGERRHRSERAAAPPPQQPPPPVEVAAAMAAPEGVPSLLVVYGSQTGNAQDVAERVAREAARRHHRPRLFPADAYAAQAGGLPAEAAAVFVVSTTGQGDAPENFARLWRLLRRASLPPGSLAGLRFAVFGLGDSAYAKYNIVAKMLHRRLEALGAAPLAALGLGDDQHRAGYDAALDPWLAALWPALRAAAGPLPRGLAEPAADDAGGAPAPKYRVTPLSGPPPGAPTYRSAHEEAVAAAAALDALDAAAHSAAPAAPGAGAGAPPSAARPHFATLRANERLTAPGHDQDVRLLDFDLGDSGVAFAPGGVLALWPQQPAAAVAAFLARAGLDTDAWVAVEPAPLSEEPSASTDGAQPPPRAALRVGALVAGALDVASAPPRRVFFQALAAGAPPGPLADRLAHFASPAGRDDLDDYCRRERRTVAEVLADFPAVAAPPLAALLSFAPRLRPRRFSAASALSLLPRRAQLLVAVVDWVAPSRRRRRGLCSSWLAGLEPGARVPVWGEPGALRPPADPAVPLLMVGPGTGVAPARAILQDRLAARRAAAAAGGAPPAPCVLAYGCRKAAADLLCGADWAEFQRAGVLGGAAGSGLLLACSRDQPGKVYVQHRLREHGAAVWSLLAGGGAVLVAGSANKMPADVTAALRDVAAEHGALAPADAEAFVRRLEATGRLQVEAWS